MLMLKMQGFTTSLNLGENLTGEWKMIAECLSFCYLADEFSYILLFVRSRLVHGRNGFFPTTSSFEVSERLDYYATKLVKDYYIRAFHIVLVYGAFCRSMIIISSNFCRSMIMISSY